jgi:hypothetical protein
VATESTRSATKRRGGVNKGATAKNSITSPEGIERRQRDLQCVELRHSGATWHQIADQLGYASKGHAYTRFMVVMRDYPREDVETWRNTISDRYDAMIRALWPEVLRGKWLAIDRVTRILEAQAKLHGANRPEKIQMVPGEVTLDEALRELSKELERRATLSGAPVPEE